MTSRTRGWWGTLTIVGIVQRPSDMTNVFMGGGSAEGQWMHDLAQRLWPFPRSLTGDGVRQTLSVISEFLPGFQIHEIPSGAEVLDWTIPDEWNIRDAWLADSDGTRVIDFADSNVHVVSYSVPIGQVVDWDELNAHLHSDSQLPDAIPYVTSYYNRTWGLCLPHRQREAMKPGSYHVHIDCDLGPGSLSYGEWALPATRENAPEVFISTYVCHPSLANNELSGPVVAVGLACWLQQLPDRNFTYRFAFIPETIGAIAYLSEKLPVLQKNVVAGFNLTCIGDDGDYSYLASRDGNLPIDRIARRVVRRTQQPVEYSYLDRGSDERQYGAPGVDLPLISLMRTKYGAYPEYHTSLDDLDFITPSGLGGGLNLVRDCIQELESSVYYQTNVLGEPQLGKRGLYHTMHARTVADEILLRTHVLAYSDGRHSRADMAEIFDRSEEELNILIQELMDHGLLSAALLQPRK
jgi:aminopeptidase-like protein